eukprot:scaffold935_cov248-Pinguiococcus_pyrenoidosus.AAC.5
MVSRILRFSLICIHGSASHYNSLNITSIPITCLSQRACLQPSQSDDEVRRALPHCTDYCARNEGAAGHPF